MRTTFTPQRYHQDAKRFAQFMDADGTLTYNRDLKYLRQKAFEVEYADLKAVTLFPVDTSPNPANTSVVSRIYDASGKAAWMNGQAKDLPRVDVGSKESELPIRRAWVGFGYTFFEMETCNFTGERLEARRAEAARRALEELIDDSAWNGYAPNGVKGLFNYTEIEVINVADPGSGTEWSNKTPDQILVDINTTFNDISEDSKEKEAGSMLALPTKQHNDLWSRRIDGTAETLVSYLLRSSKWLKSEDQIVSIPQLAGKGAAGVDRGFVYDKNPDKVELVLPQLPTFLPAFQEQLDYVTPVIAATSGVHYHKPRSARFMDGI